MSRGKSVGLFTGNGDDKKGFTIEDCHNGAYSIYLVSANKHDEECHLAIRPNVFTLHSFIFDLAWMLDFEVMNKSESKSYKDRIRNLEKKNTELRKQIKGLQSR